MSAFFLAKWRGGDSMDMISIIMMILDKAIYNSISIIIVFVILFLVIAGYYKD